MIPSATTSGPDGFVPHAGGAVFNTACALGRFGVERRSGKLHILRRKLGWADALRALGPPCVIVTQGVKGATAYVEQAEVSVPVSVVQVVANVTAAQWETALAFGAKVAGMSLTRR